jgi:hypothetical protein
MPDIFQLISVYFSAIALVFAAANYWRAKRAAMKSVPPAQIAEAQDYLRNFAIAGALPWVIMGIGQLTGKTPTVWYYFRPQDENVFVLAWLATIFVLSGSFAWWVFFAGGAKKVVEYNLMATLGQRSGKPPSEKMVKFSAALCVVIFPIWVYGVISMNAVLPR